MRLFGRIVLTLVLTISCVTVLVVSSNTVKADPHATFFTAIGQRQLFFNMLAALDQADYVEPAQNELGTPSGNSRQEILDKREAAGFPANDDPVLKSTETELSSVLTRSVTLEGQDMWSAYMSFQLALEVDRRRNSTELIKLLCERGLGIRKCEEGVENPKVARAREEHAYNKRPLDQLAAQQLSANYALRYVLNPEYDQMERKDILSEDSIDPNKDRPFNYSAASLADNTKDDPLANQMVRSMVSNVLNLNTSGVDPNMYSNTSVGDNGHIRFGGETDTASAFQKLARMLTAPTELLGAAISAQAQKKSLDSEIYASGARADTRGIPSGTTINEKGLITNVNEELIAPGYSKRKQLESALEAITELQTNSAFTGTQENIPGTQPLVRENESEGSVQGASTKNSPSGSRVAAATDGEDDDSNTHPGGIETDKEILPKQGPENPVNRGASPIGSSQEKPVIDFLQLLVGGNHRGLGFSLDDFLAAYGDDILGGLNS